MYGYFPSSNDLINPILFQNNDFNNYTDDHANNYLFYCDNNQLFVDIDFINHTWSNFVLDTFMTSLAPHILQFFINHC